MIKKIVIIFTLAFLLLSCKKNLPVPIIQDGKSYQVINWDGGEYSYIDFKFNLKNVNEAIDIGKQFWEMSKKRGFNEEVIGFLPGVNWKIGILNKNIFDLDSINGYKIKKMVVIKGLYGSMKFKGHPENMFNYYNSFKKQLLKDGYKVKSDVIEYWIYDTFNNETIPIEERIGEIRYLIEK